MIKNSTIGSNCQHAISYWHIANIVYFCFCGLNEVAFQQNLKKENTWKIQKKLITTLVEKEGLNVDTFMEEFGSIKSNHLHINIEPIAKKLSGFNEGYENTVMESFWKERIPEDAPNGYICEIAFGDSATELLYCRNKEDLEPIILEHVKLLDWSVVKEGCRPTGEESLKDLLIRFPDADVFESFAIFAIPEKSGLMARKTIME